MKCLKPMSGKLLDAISWNSFLLGFFKIKCVAFSLIVLGTLK